MARRKNCKHFFREEFHEGKNIQESKNPESIFTGEVVPRVIVQGELVKGNCLGRKGQEAAVSFMRGNFLGDTISGGIIQG